MSVKLLHINQPIQIDQKHLQGIVIPDFLIDEITACAHAILDERDIVGEEG
ncbi:hypothetical protein D1872_233080 [compost metagenome]